MKKSLLALAAMVVGACAAVSAGANVIVDRASDFGRTAVRVVANAVNRAVLEYAVLSGSPLALGLLTKADTFTGKLPVRTQPISSELLEACFPFQMPDVNPSAGDILAIAANLAPGVEIVDYTIVVDDMDSNGAPAIVFSLGSLNAGLTDLATTYAAALTTMQAGGLARAANAAHWLESNAAARSIGLKFTTPAATYAGTGKKGMLILRLRG